MKILHKYILLQLLRNLLLTLAVFVFLFLLFDFFDRIDNIFAENASLLVTFQYFLYKVPLMVSLMLPVSMMVATLLTIGLLSKSSEITAMRASGITVFTLALPIFISGLLFSGINILLNETIVPESQRRSREIYNIDIRQKDKRGSYSQSDFWWRTKDSFYSVSTFDSRTNTLHDVSIFQLDNGFNVQKRTDANQVQWVNKSLGWTMRNVNEYRFSPNRHMDAANMRSLPLPIKDSPSDFYDVKTDPYTMSMKQLRQFIKKQATNGISVSGYLPYLYEKLAFPFVNFIIVLVVLPFALRPARSGTMATSIIAALIIGFSYYALHSFSLALGKAELMPAFLSAWMADIVMGFVGVVLLLGTEAPN